MKTVLQRLLKFFTTHNLVWAISIRKHRQRKSKLLTSLVVKLAASWMRIGTCIKNVIPAVSFDYRPDNADAIIQMDEVNWIRTSVRIFSGKKSRRVTFGSNEA